MTAVVAMIQVTEGSRTPKQIAVMQQWPNQPEAKQQEMPKAAYILLNILFEGYVKEDILQDQQKPAVDLGKLSALDACAGHETANNGAGKARNSSTQVPKQGSEHWYKKMSTEIINTWDHKT